MEFCRELYTVAVFGHSRRKLAHVPRALVTRNRVSKMAEMRSRTRTLLLSRNTCYARRLDTRSCRFSLYDPCSIRLFASRKYRRKKGKEKKSSQHFTESKLRAYCFETFQDESCTESSRFSWRTVTIAIFGRYSVTCFVTCFFYTTNDEQRLNASKDITFLHLQEMDTYTNRHQNVTAIDTDALLSLAFFRKRNILICERVSWRITRRQLSGDRRSLLTYPERFVKCVVHVRAVFDRRDNIF